MKSFNLLSKKSLSFALFALVFCNQSLFSMDGSGNSDKKLGYDLGSWLNPMAYVRWNLGTGEYALKKDETKLIDKVFKQGLNKGFKKGLKKDEEIRFDLKKKAIQSSNLSIRRKKTIDELTGKIKKLDYNYKINEKDSKDSYEAKVKRLENSYESKAENLKMDYEMKEKGLVSDQKVAVNDKIFTIQDQKRTIFNLESIKNPTFYSMMCKNKKKTAAIFLGGVVTTVAIGGITYYFYKRYQKNKMEREKNLTLADRFVDINEEVVNMYKSIDAGIKNTEMLFVKTSNTQREILISEIRNTEMQTLMGNIRNENWVKGNSRKIRNGLEGFKAIHKSVTESILDESIIKKNCKVIQRIHDNLKKLSSKRTENNEEIAKQIGKDYTFVLESIQSPPRYSSCLRLIILDMKTLQNDLFDGADKSEKFQVCKFQINPTEWSNGINSRYKKLKKELTKIKTTKNSKHSHGFLIEKDHLDDSLFNFKEENTSDKIGLIKTQGKKWKKSQKPLTKLYNSVSKCSIL